MEANEVFRLLLALVLSPAIVSIGYRVRLPKSRLGLGIAYASVMAGNVFSMIERFAQPGIFLELQHVSFALAGVALLSSTLVTRRQVTHDTGVGS